MADFPEVGGMIGVGLGQYSAPDIYFGGSLNYFAPLVLNAGWVLQKGQELPADIRIGDTWPADLSTDRFRRRYQRAGFVGFAIVR